VKAVAFDRNIALKIINAFDGFERRQIVFAPDQFQAKSLRAEQGF